MDNNIPSKNFPLFEILISVIGIIIILNLIYIDIFQFNDTKPQIQIPKTVAIPSLAPDPDYTATCPNSCISQIYQATASSQAFSQTIEPTATPTSIAPTKNPIPTVTPAPPTSAPQIKEFFISFGSGTNSSGDWEDVAGLKVSIDSSNFPSMKSAVFEASINIPTGNQTAYVRLFNETDGHPVWYSELSLEGGVPQFLISKPITLDSGNKTYKIQMKTSLKYQANLNQARIHILLK
jgi:hypothetical protein